MPQETFASLIADFGPWPPRQRLRAVAGWRRLCPLHRNSHKAACFHEKQPDPATRRQMHPRQVHRFAAGPRHTKTAGWPCPKYPKDAQRLNRSSELGASMQRIAWSRADKTCRLLAQRWWAPWEQAAAMNLKVRWNFDPLLPYRLTNMEKEPLWHRQGELRSQEEATLRAATPSQRGALRAAPESVLASKATSAATCQPRTMLPRPTLDGTLR